MPSFLLSTIQGAPTLVTLDGSFNFNKQFETGIQYTSSRGLGATGLLQFGEGLKVGYAYTSSSNNANNIRNGTHEIVLKIRLDKPIEIEQPTENINSSTQEKLILDLMKKIYTLCLVILSIGLSHQGWAQIKLGDNPTPNLTLCFAGTREHQQRFGGFPG